MNSNTQQANRYFVVPPRTTAPIAFDPLDPNDRPTYDCMYYGGALAYFEQHAGMHGLTFYLTFDVEHLPSYGPDVIAIVQADEWARVPRYVHAIRATFKGYGTRLAIGAPPLHRPSILTLASLAQYIRLNRYRIPTIVRHVWQTVRRGPAAGPLVPIPIGYMRQIALPNVPILERRFDAYFKGSTQQREFPRSSIKYWLRSAKTIARQQMINSLQAVHRRHPALNIEVGTLPAYFSGSDEDAYEYSATMTQTKVCLVPRGASLETYRYFEAFRAGCVVIAEPLPDYWFYRGSPAFQISDWSRLEDLLVPLLRDSALLERKHREGLAWWDERIGEVAIGQYIWDVLADSAKTFALRHARRGLGHG